METTPWRRPVVQAGLSFVLLTLASAALYGGLLTLDYQGSPPGPLTLAADVDVADIIAGMAEVTVAVLGVAVTVVAIIVQLAADRYTPRVSDLFVKDPVNVGVMSFFVLTAVLVLWVDFTVAGEVHPTYLITAAIGFMSISLLALLPYFAYVFDFLDPTQVILRIQRRTAAGLGSASGNQNLPMLQQKVLSGTEQLGELALNAIENHDKAIGITAVRALAGIADTALQCKSELPEGWFRCTGPVSDDQDFVALHPDMVITLEERRTWVEMKVFRQYQAVFGASLNKVRDVAHMVTIHTRHIAARAHETQDREALNLTIRFMNTYLRSAINGGDIRTAYNLFNEYRGLVEDVMQPNEQALVLDLANHFRFYGLLSFQRNQPFLLETVAYDMCSLLEQAHKRDLSYHDALLNVFLELDREPDEENGSQEASLRGVRKAQIKLATYYLVHGEMKRARRICEDMRHEPTKRLRSIREELEAITEAEYWEVSDRGINFDWLPDDQRARLGDFFAWFDVPPAPTAGPAQSR